MTAEVNKIPTLFISYSHKDEDWKDRLMAHLGVLRHEGIIELWEDRRIAAGDEWHGEIREAMNDAGIAVLLVSANFLNSNFIMREEVPHLLQRRSKQGLRVFPIIIKPCAWHAVAWLRRMQLRPTDGRPLSEGDENQVDSDLSSIALEIYQLLKSAPRKEGAKGTVAVAPGKISISRLPVTGRKLFGRHRELEFLDRAWRDPGTNVVSVVAWGGVGKSALINHWLRKMEREQYCGAERVYAWSFYRQGTGEHVVSADEFTASTLAWFGDPNPAEGTTWEKGVRLAQLVKAQRTLLLLDGLEPLQFPPGEQEGRLKDQALKALLRELASFNPGLCLVSSRTPLTDLDDFGGGAALSLNLEHLPAHAGAQILKAQGVKGDAEKLRQAAKEYGGHSLALTLLGSYLSDVLDGDISRRTEVELEDDVRLGGKAQQVMAAYERWFGEGPEVSVLRLLGLFDRPADTKALRALRAAPAIPGLTDALQNLSENEWRRVLSKLRRARLLAEIDPVDPGGLDAHPLVREHFERQLRMQRREAWRLGNDRLYEHFKHRAKELPETIQEMSPLFMAVAYGCNAGRHQDAFSEVYHPRIMRGEQGYAARMLGAYGALLSVLVYFFEDGDWSRPVTPHLPERQGLEPADQLTVLMHAGLSLMVTKGYASDEMQSCYQRVQELCTRLGKTSLLYSALLGQWRYCLATAELAFTLQHAEAMQSLAEGQDDPALLSGAYSALATTTYHMGRFELAKKYAQQGISAWDPQRVVDSTAEYYTPIITNLDIAAFVLWHTGYPDQAQQRIHESVSLARKVSDLNALTVALYGMCYVNQLCGDKGATLSSARELVEVCSVQGFELYLAVGKVLKGWALAASGRTKEGVASMKQGVQSCHRLGVGLNTCYFLVLQADVMGNLGRADEAVALLDEALSFADRFGEHWCLAEVYRLKGEMLLRQERRDEAETSFSLALNVARAQASKSLELRASLSLSRWRRKQGREEEAQQILSDAFRGFTEGFQTADLQAARALLGRSS